MLYDMAKLKTYGCMQTWLASLIPFYDICEYEDLVVHAHIINNEPFIAPVRLISRTFIANL